jgi:hypothetical protein
MTTSAGFKDLLRIAAGAAITLLVMLLIFHYRGSHGPAEELAFQSKRVDLVDRMRLALAEASEAEKSAVLAVTDQDSQTYADQARAATTQVEQARAEMAKLLQTGGTPAETVALDQFAAGFAEFQRIDRELLALAVKNTNLKAYSLAYGPAADAIKDIDGALTRLVAKNQAASQALNIILPACGAQAAALRIQALLPPHIAEESDAKMDELEAAMTKEDQLVRQDLDSLAAVPGLKDDTDLATAASSYARFSNLRKQVLALSRQNTNVRSLAISLDQKRKVMFACQDALAALKQAIVSEPVAGAGRGQPANPR